MLTGAETRERVYTLSHMFLSCLLYMNQIKLLLYHNFEHEMKVPHLIVGHQEQPHQRGVEDRLRDVSRLPRQAVLGHQGPAQGLA